MITLWLLDVIKNYWSEGFPFFELMIRVDFLCFCGFCMQLSVNEKIEDLEVFELFTSFLLRGIFFYLLLYYWMQLSCQKQDLFDGIHEIKYSSKR